MARYLVGKIQRSQVLALLRSLYREGRSGQLEIEYGEGSETVFFVSGSIYLRPTSPIVSQVVEWSGDDAVGESPGRSSGASDPTQGLQENVAEACLAEVLSSWIPSSIRFIDSLNVNAKNLVGPFQTDLLLDHLGTGAPKTSEPAPEESSPATATGNHRGAIPKGNPPAAAQSAPIESPNVLETQEQPTPGGGQPSIIPGPWVNHSSATETAEQTSSSSPRRPEGHPPPVANQPGRAEPESPDIKTPEAGPIWLEHFGLREAPFSLTPDPSYFFMGANHVEALAGLKLGLIEKRGLIVLVGEVGTGKTTVVYSLLSSLESETETAYVSNPSLSFDEILESALKDLGAELTGDRRLDRLEALNQFLLKSERSGKSVAIVIDEAQGLSRRGYEQLRLLLNFETFKNKMLQIILVGQPELAQRLARPELRQIADRIAVRCQLKPLKGQEAEKYIAHRLEAAGGSLDLFTVPARRLLVRASRGNPRRINVVGHNAMLFAFAKGAARVDRSVVAEAIRDIKG